MSYQDDERLLRAIDEHKEKYADIYRLLNGAMDRGDIPMNRFMACMKELTALTVGLAKGQAKEGAMYQNCEDDQSHERLRSAIESIKLRFPDVVMSFNIDINRGIFTEKDFYNFLSCISLSFGRNKRKVVRAEDMKKGFSSVMFSILESISTGDFSEERFALFCTALQNILSGGRTMNKSERDQALRELAQKIVEVLISDKDVMKMLHDLKQSGVFSEDQVLGVALKVSDILKMTEDTKHIKSNQNLGGNAMFDNLHKLSKEQQEKFTQKSDTIDGIDGRELSENEVAFQKYTAEKFDKEKWLKKVGLLSLEHTVEQPPNNTESA